MLLGQFLFDVMVDPPIETGFPALPSLDWWSFGLWLVRRRSRLRVQGRSMLPLLRPDDELLIDPRAYRHRPPRVGDLLVAEHPQRPGLRLIKRVAAVAGDRCLLLGDNPLESNDSRDFGWVALAQVQGRVCCRFG